MTIEEQAQNLFKEYSLLQLKSVLYGGELSDSKTLAVQKAISMHRKENSKKIQASKKLLPDGQ